MTQQIKAIFFDIDGTLRDFQTGRIPESSKKALKRAKEAGILLFIATGRHKLEMEEENLLEELNFDGYVTLNGQYCYCGEDAIYDAPICPKDIEAMLDAMKEEPFPCMFMEADCMYINMVDDVVEKAQQGIGTRIPPVCSVMRAMKHPIYQMVPYISAEKATSLKPQLPNCEFIRWHDECASDIVPMGGGKCIGIGKMAEHFGISVQEIAAIGDGENDVSMVSYAGLGIAMGNGKKAVKAAADYITDSIEQDGLSKAVFYILDNNHQEE